MKRRSKGVEDVPILCPLCGRELKEGSQTQEGWLCKCGEFIPFGLEIDPFTGSAGVLDCKRIIERKR